MQSYTTEQKERALTLLINHSVTEVSEIMKIKRPTIYYWSKYTPKSIEKANFQPQTLSHQISKIKAYLIKKHGTLQLSIKQAFDEINDFSRGSELGDLLHSPRLPTLGVSDIARYIVLYT